MEFDITKSRILYESKLAKAVIVSRDLGFTDGFNHKPKLSRDLTIPFRQRAENLTRIVRIKRRLNDQTIPSLREKLEAIDSIDVANNTFSIIEQAVAEGLLPSEELSWITAERSRILNTINPPKNDQKPVLVPDTEAMIGTNIQTESVSPELELVLKNANVVLLKDLYKEVNGIMIYPHPEAILQLLDKSEDHFDEKTKKSVLTFIKSPSFAKAVEKTAYYFENPQIGSEQDFLSRLRGYFFEQLAYQDTRKKIRPKLNSGNYIITTPEETADVYLINHSNIGQDPFGFAYMVENKTIPDGIIIELKDKKGIITGVCEYTCSDITNGIKDSQLSFYQKGRKVLVQEIQDMLGLSHSLAAEALKRSHKNLPSYLSVVDEDDLKIMYTIPSGNSTYPHLEDFTIRTTITNNNLNRFLNAYMFDVRQMFRENGSLTSDAFEAVFRY